MILGVFMLLACQLAGEAIKYFLALPVPGPVVGMVLLFACLAVSRHVWVEPKVQAERAADGLLGVLGLFFVPAGVGIVQSYGLIMQNGLAILAVLVVSTLLTLLSTVVTFRLCRRALGQG